MREIKFRGKRVDNGEWVYRYYCFNPFFKRAEIFSFDSDRSYVYQVDHETVVQYTGLKDRNGVEIYEGDIVKFNGDMGTVAFECGCFGIGFNKTIDYDAMIDEIHEATGCNNDLCSCQNDNFISLWEIHWNYNEEENTLYSVEVIGNIYKNPELLGG